MSAGPPDLRRPAKPAVTVAPKRPAPPRARRPLPIDMPAPDPFDGMQFADDLEVASGQQLDSLQAGFRERAKAEADRFKLATASDYYGCLVFQSGEQLTAFLKAVGMENSGDLFIDGLDLAHRLGITLPPADVPKNISAKVDPKLARLVKPQI